ncbi:MAG: PHB depolymerase family esterase [Pseudomonadota bacterium]
MTSKLCVAFVAVLALAACESATSKPASSPVTSPSETSGLSAGRTEQSLTVGGRDRNYLLFLPDNFKTARNLPIVFAFHGGGDNANSMADWSSFPALARREGFVLVIPNGTFNKRNNGGTWNTDTPWVQGSAERLNVDDVAFFDAMLERIAGQVSIDRSRVFATGMSKGGMMSYHLACHRAEQLRAIAPVAATMTTQTCDPSGSVDILHLHGSSDATVPLNGGRGSMTMSRKADYRSVTSTLTFWADEASCSTTTKQGDRGAEYSCSSYCGSISYCVFDGGHSWPGMPPAKWQERLNVKVPQTFDATEYIWSYFEDLR